MSYVYARAVGARTIHWSRSPASNRQPSVYKTVARPLVLERQFRFEFASECAAPVTGTSAISLPHPRAAGAKNLVGAARFERATTALQTRDAARLHHAPMQKAAAPASLGWPDLAQRLVRRACGAQVRGFRAVARDCTPARRAVLHARACCVGCGCWNWRVSATFSASGIVQFAAAPLAAIRSLMGLYHGSYWLSRGHYGYFWFSVE